MPFPETTRMSYKKNPLDIVICQLRFPPILKIDSEPPSSFQDVIRNDYPLYRESVQLHKSITISPLPSNSQDIISPFANPVSFKVHEFSSPDDSCKINLTRTSLSLSMTKYVKWEDFREKFNIVYGAFLDFYKSPFFTRTGLRYVDIIDRSRLGLKNVSWGELLESHVLGLLSTTIEPNIRSFNNSYNIALEDGESFLVMSTSFVLNAKSGEKCFRIDSDFNNPKRTAPQDIFNKLEFLHARATRLIRWIITDKLHQAMEPSDL